MYEPEGEGGSESVLETHPSMYDTVGCTAERPTCSERQVLVTRFCWWCAVVVVLVVVGVHACHVCFVRIAREWSAENSEGC